MLKRIFSTLMITLFFAVAAFTVFMFATETTAAQSAEYCTRESGKFLDFPTWYKYLNPTFDGTECKLDVSIPESIPNIVLAIFEILIRIAGMLAVIFVVVGGFQYLTSTGEPEKAKNARTTIINALVGMMIAMFATVIVNLIGRNIG